jgi:hypothetical protein
MVKNWLRSAMTIKKVVLREYNRGRDGQPQVLKVEPTKIIN